MFAATGGLKKPQNHLMLGIAVKSLTGSRKVVEIMDSLVHCISYHIKEEIQTEATFETTKNNLFTPSGMNLFTPSGMNLFTPSGMNLDLQCGTAVARDKAI